MTTHSLPSQTFGTQPSILAALRRWLSGRPTARTTVKAENRLDEANRVRTYANSVRSHDPRFAADLFAAADRHERQAP